MAVKKRLWNKYFPGACWIACLVCLRALRVCVLACSGAWRIYVLTCLACLRAYVLACLVCLCVCEGVLVIMKCFFFLHVCVLGALFCLICFTFQYLNLKILTAKKLCALLSWTYFLFTFWYQLKQYQFFTIYIFTYYINFCWTHCFCLIYCQSNYWLLSLFNTITFLDRWMKCCSFVFVCSK